MVGKVRRKQNEEAIKKIQALPCAVCGKKPPSDVHHWRSRGSGGHDDLTNLLSLCRREHVKVHQMGRITFWERYRVQILMHLERYNLPMLEDHKLKTWKREP